MKTKFTLFLLSFSLLFFCKVTGQDTIPGLVITEAMSVGKPVVVSDLGAPPEIVREGIDGFVVSPSDSAGLADRMSRLLADPGLRARMGSNGKARVLETYDPAVIAGRFISLYEAMLKGERG